MKQIETNIRCINAPFLKNGVCKRCPDAPKDGVKCSGSCKISRFSEEPIIAPANMLCSVLKGKGFVICINDKIIDALRASGEGNAAYIDDDNIAIIYSNDVNLIKPMSISDYEEMKTKEEAKSTDDEISMDDLEKQCETK